MSQSEVRVEVQRRNANGHWEIHEFGPGEQVTLEAPSNGPFTPHLRFVERHVCVQFVDGECQ